MSSPNLNRDAIDAIVRSKTASDAWTNFRNVVRPFGFDYLLYGTNRLRGDGVFGKRHDSFFLSDLPKSIMDQLWEQELYRTTPVAIWAMQNEGAMSFNYGSQLFHAGLLSPEQHATQSALVDAGISSGYVIGFNPPNTTVATAVALINLGRSQEDADEIWNEYGALISTYASILRLCIASLPIPSGRAALTSRQAEVLFWVARGKTSAEVATILGLSSATIEKHLRQARETLGVSTTTQAVLYAQINGHIFTSRRERTPGESRSAKGKDNRTLTG